MIFSNYVLIIHENFLANSHLFVVGRSKQMFHMRNLVSMPQNQVRQAARPLNFLLELTCQQSILKLIRIYFPLSSSIIAFFSLIQKKSRFDSPKTKYPPSSSYGLCYGTCSQIITLLSASKRDSFALILMKKHWLIWFTHG